MRRAGDGEEAPDDGPGRRGVETLDREVEERLRRERDHGDADAAARTMNPRSRGSGCRSARRPPSQYPTASAARMIPIRFAQTIVDEPKYGARSRDAVISVASAPMPAPKTSAPSARLPGRCPPVAASTRRLEAEDALDLAERASGDHAGDDHDEREHEPEPHARPALLTMPLLPGRAPRAVEPVVARDRVGVERRVVLADARIGVVCAGCATGEF